MKSGLMRTRLVNFLKRVLGGLTGPCGPEPLPPTRTSIRPQPWMKKEIRVSSKPRQEPLSSKEVNNSVDHQKPLAVISPPGGTHEVERMTAEKQLTENGIPVYPGFDHAAKAIANVIKYWEWRNNSLP